MRAMSLIILCYILQPSNSATGLEDVVAKSDPQRSYAASAPTTPRKVTYITRERISA